MTNLTIGQINNTTSCFSKFQLQNCSPVQSVSAKQDSFDSNKKCSKMRSVIAYTAGIVTFLALPNMLHRQVYKIIKKYAKTDKDLGINFEKVKLLAEKMYCKYQLKNYGHIYDFIDPKMNKDIFNETIKIILKKEMTIEDFKKWAQNYHSAFCFPRKLKNGYIALAVKENASGIFHELGHLINKQNKILNIFTNVYTRISAVLLIIPIFITALICNKNEKHKKKSTLNKTTDFIHKNAGSLAFLCFMPTLLSEGFATRAALNFIKKNDKSIIIPLRNRLIGACSKHLSISLIVVLSVKLGLFVKEKIQNWKQ